MSFVLENYQAISATDACGIAEPATIATAAAVANAVYNAIGVRILTTALSADALLAENYLVASALLSRGSSIATPTRAKLFHEEPDAGKLHIRHCDRVTRVF